MAFDPTKYKVPKAKKLPVVLLLDVSGSMSGDKIDSLYDSVVDMLDAFSKAAQQEKEIVVSIITFGESVNLHTAYTPVCSLSRSSLEKFVASGMTPMGTALKMAKDMIEDKLVTPSDVYRPAVVLVSDGEPTDEWETPLDAFIENGRSSKCQRFAVAIGQDANVNVLKKFSGRDDTIFYADNSEEIVKVFETISMSVSMRVASSNPSMFGTPAAPAPTLSTSPKATQNTSVDDEDDDDGFM